MSRAEKIYPLEKGLKRQVALAEKDEVNGNSIVRFYKVRSSQVSPATLLLEMIRVNEISKLLGKKFEDATRVDIEDLIFKIDQKHKALSTQNRIRKIIRAFYKWLRNSPRDIPPEIAWITLHREPLVKVTADDLLTYEECVKITEAADNLRDKALFQCKLDAGCRIGEILTVSIKEVKFNDAGAILYSEGKTGYQPIILTWSSKTLAQWLNIHPFRDNPEAPLFPVLTKSRPEQLKYSAAAISFRRAVRKAGFKRRVWLHLFRHVSSTHDSINGMPDSYRKYKHHWAPNSRMSQVYEHLSAEIIPRIQNSTWKILDGSDRPIASEQKPLVLTKVCTRCNFENPRDLKFCGNCAFVLDEKKAMETAMVKAKIDSLLERLTNDPEKLDKLLALID